MPVSKTKSSVAFLNAFNIFFEKIFIAIVHPLDNEIDTPTTNDKVTSGIIPQIGLTYSSILVERIFFMTCQRFSDSYLSACPSNISASFLSLPYSVRTWKKRPEIVNKRGKDKNVRTKIIIGSKEIYHTVYQRNN